LAAQRAFGDVPSALRRLKISKNRGFPEKRKKGSRLVRHLQLKAT